MRLKIRFENQSITKSVIDGDIEKNTNGTLTEISQKGIKPYSGKMFLKNISIGFVIALICYGILKSTFISYAILGAALLYSLYLYFFRNTPHIEIEYELDEKTSKHFANLVEKFNTVNSASKIWEITGGEDVKDTKYSGGANRSVDRHNAESGYSLPYFVSAENLQVPSFQLHSGKLYFLPDRILLDASGISEFQYSDLTLSLSQSRFHESESLPKDAKVIGKTWKYVNKKGGPDKRFNDNKEIPVCQYERLHIYLGGNAYDVMLSKIGAGESFGQALLDYKNSIKFFLLADAITKMTNKSNADKFFSENELTNIAHGAILMMLIDGDVDEKEVAVLSKFIKEHYPDDAEKSSDTFLGEIVQKYKDTHGDSNLETKLSAIAEKLTLDGDQKQEVITLYQAIMMADGTSSDEEQLLLEIFVKHI